MKRLLVRTGFVLLLLSAKSHAQSGAVIPQADAAHAPQSSCVILKRMGRIDRSKSRLYSFGISGKRFRYIEGKLPEGFSFHGKLTDHDVRNLQAHGAQVLVLDSHYTSEDLREARADCQRETIKTANQVEAKALAAQPRGVIASDSDPSPTEPTPKSHATKPPAAKVRQPEAEDSALSAGTTVAALLDVSSTPAEAEVYVDEQLSGRTPATLILMPGDHKLVIKKDGFVVWERKFNLPSGRSNVDAALVRKAK